MEGMGIYIWNDGRQYQGQYKDDKKHGFGVYTWADGRTYTGYWKNGKQEGEGKYYIPSENIELSGIWQNGKRLKWL